MGISILTTLSGCGITDGCSRGHGWNLYSDDHTSWLINKLLIIYESTLLFLCKYKYVVNALPL